MHKNAKKFNFSNFSNPHELFEFFMNNKIGLIQMFEEYSQAFPKKSLCKDINKQQRC